ncbi:hypothetical protein FS749_001586 [Ceratobasidium sp. UAMH 11750]|nr:hypothetical protein FS749_001586 [Ceratobasidium sp. UAMH 11750]
MSKPMDEQNNVCEDLQPGVSIELPAEEHTYLNEEYFFKPPHALFGRVLSCFEFRRHGARATIDAGSIAEDGSSDIEVIGVVGTIYNKEGLFAQCGWFGDYDLDWFWVRIKGIRWLEVRSDIRFRRGESCVWLGTQLGEYAMLLPHDDYRDIWESTLAALGPRALSASFRQWPPYGTRPHWWSVRWKDNWPFDKGAGSKRRPSTDMQDYETEERRQDAAPGCSWQLVGPRGDTHDEGEMRTNISQRAPWVLRVDGGMAATHAAGGGHKKRDLGTGGKGVSRNTSQSSRRHRQR